MKLPFTTEQFLEVFKNYNTAIWPLQIVFFLSAVFIVGIVMLKISSKKIIFPVLAVLWLWMGIIYHTMFFSSINEAAYVFGPVFMIEGILLLRFSYLKSPVFEFRKNLNGFAGLLLIIYGLIVYPVVGYFNGHVYPYSPTFGVPCPTTIFTFGMFILSKNKLPFYLFIIPSLWSALGLTAAFKLGIYEDSGLIAAAVTSFIFNSTKYKSITFRTANFRHKMTGQLFK